jgi:hypothetical protein
VHGFIAEKREELEGGDGYRVLKEDTFVGLLRV